MGISASSTLHRGGEEGAEAQEEAGLWVCASPLHFHPIREKAKRGHSFSQGTARDEILPAGLW